MDQLALNQYKKPQLWMAATVLVILAATVGSWLILSGQIHSPTRTATTQSGSEQTATVSAKAASADLKAIDLSSLKNSLNDLKSLISAF